MSNPYYVYSGAFIPGILARAEAETTEFQAVQAGFAILAIQGTDSGAADAYVVTTKGAANGIYADGMIVEFKAAHSNTGAAATINVDSGGAVGLTDFQGQTLAGGAIKANSWVRLMYNSTYSAWTLIAPTSQVITSNTISAAAPTNKVGLTAAGGVSLACIPIDATFAIDQSIAPTWTGVHTFSNTVNFNSTVNFTGGLTLTGLADQYAITLDGANSAGHSFGLEVLAGKNASDACALFANQGGATQFAKIDGAGSVTIGNPTGGGQGVGTINAQGLYINGTAAVTSGASGANPATKVTLSVSNGTATTFMRSDAGLQLDVSIAPTWTGNHAFQGAGIPVSINPGANKNGLVVTGGTNTANTWLAEFITGQAAGFSSGVLIQAATNSSDTALSVQTASGGLNIFSCYGDGEVLVNAPTAAGLQGANFYNVGFLDLPIQSSANTPVFQSRGKLIDATGTVTIPANASVAYPIGSTFMIYNDSSSAITVGITTDTLTWIPNNTNGNRTLAAHGLATVYKKASTTWLIWGFGLS